MTLADLILIGKKILVGIVIYLAASSIIIVGLWLTQKLLTEEKTTAPPDHYRQQVQNL